LRVALDTNLLVYAEGLGNNRRCDLARSAIISVADGNLFIPTQALMELFNVLQRKAGLDGHAARQRVEWWRSIGYPVATDSALLLDAMDLSSRHQIRIWDAVILAAAASMTCAALLSEDMHHGFIWHGTTVVNPFQNAAH
jgi:predicted nucleic acid-binding protein